MPIRRPQPGTTAIDYRAQAAAERTGHSKPQESRMHKRTKQQNKPKQERMWVRGSIHSSRNTHEAVRMHSKSAHAHIIIGKHARQHVKARLEASGYTKALSAQVAASVTWCVAAGYIAITSQAIKNASAQERGSKLLAQLRCSRAPTVLVKSNERRIGSCRGTGS